MSLIAILILGAVLSIAWRLVRLAVRVALLIALIAAIANYGSHLTQHNHPRPVPAQHAR